MERLTEEKQIGCFASLKDKSEAKPGAFADYNCFYAHSVAVTRLKAYEDTGMEPEDMKRAFNDDAVLKLAGQALGTTTDRLRQLAEGDTDGRCVVLPCKVGDTLYEVDLPEYGVITCKVLYIEFYNGPLFHVLGNDIESSVSVCVEVIEGHGKMSSYCFLNEDFGKTVFLTREEAEAALRGEEHA